jgi:hypothetical protein
MRLPLRWEFKLTETQDLSPVEDIDDKSHAAKDKKGEASTAVVIKPASPSLFGGGHKQKPSKTRERFSFSFPLRRLNRSKTQEQSREGN